MYHNHNAYYIFLESNKTNCFIFRQRSCYESKHSFIRRHDKQKGKKTLERRLLCIKSDSIPKVIMVALRQYLLTIHTQTNSNGCVYVFAVCSFIFHAIFAGALSRLFIVWSVSVYFCLFHSHFNSGNFIPFSFIIIILDARSYNICKKH